MTTAGVYVRISDDQAGDALGVKRQQEDCRKIAALRGWEVSSVYSDNDISAYKRSVRRPAFEQLLEDLRTGVISAVVVYDLDRFARQPRDLERAIDLFEGSRLRFATVQGDIDLSSADGRTMARVMVAFANKSSADTSRRTTRKHLELAQKGMPVGPRAFGWRADKIAIDPTEAGIIRDGARQLMAGRSLGAVTDEWNVKGYKSSLGNRWVRQTVRQMYLNPRLAGYRVYRGEILRDEAGEPVRGLWEPILDHAIWTALVARIAPPETRQGYRPGGRKYLLSGLVRCGNCGTSMRGLRKTDTTHSYFCPPENQGGCGKSAIAGHRLDAMIEALILSHLGDEQTTVSSDYDPSELETINARMQELMEAFQEGSLSGSVVFPTVQSLEAQGRSLRAQQAVAAVPRLTSAPESWPDLMTSQRREIVSTYLSAVMVRPSEAKGGRFDPERAEPVWL